MFNNSSIYEKNTGGKFDAERNTEAKKKEERREHAQKESTLQAITKNRIQN
jgi:hypothetical protein